LANLLLTEYSDYETHFVEYSTHDFRLLATSPAVDAGADSLAAPTDIDGVLRPQGAASDVGAYERLMSTSTTLSSSEAAPTILYPSPASRYIIFNEAVTDVKLFSVSGQLVKSWGEVQMGRQMDCANLVEGLYLVHFQTSTGVQGTAKIFIQRQ